MNGETWRPTERAPRWQGWEPVWGWLIDRSIDALGVVLSGVIVVLRDRWLGPLSVCIAAGGLAMLIRRRLVRTGPARSMRTPGAPGRH
jgi:hypothetical protein